MKHLSFDRRVGIAGLILAVLGITLGIGVALAMDTKTNGELYFSIGCFVFSALVLSAAISVSAYYWQADPWKRVLCAGVFGFLVLASLVLGVIWVNGRHSRAVEAENKFPVSVFPPHAIFGPKGEQFNFSVSNTSERDWYSVVVDVRLKSSGITVDQFQFDADHQIIYPETDSCGAINDPIVLGTTENDTKFPGWWFLIYRLKPHESRDIRIKRVKDGNGVDVSASVTGLAAEAQPLIVDDQCQVKFRFSRDYWIGAWFKKN